MKQSILFHLILFNLFFIPNLASQANSDFLDSLPDNVREDLMSQMESDPDQLNRNFVAPDSRVKKIEESLRDAKSLLQSLTDQVYFMNGGPEDPEMLERFGEQFFSSYQSSFSPVNEPNLSGDYILDVGDEINVQLIGEKHTNLDITIARDGSIVLPNIGKIFLAGLTLNKAEISLKKIVEEKLLGYQAILTLIKLRAMSILIIGEIEKPGMYTIAGGSIPIVALHAAGGIGKNGSYRNITHKRNNAVVQNIDLYDLFVHGNIRPNKSLRSGDVLIVKPQANKLMISGGVANQAIFEMLPGETLLDGINFAGGFQDDISDQIVYEVNNVDSFNSFLINKSDLGSTKVTNNSVLKIDKYTSMSNGIKVATIQGSIKNPGIYTLKEGETLSKLIQRAGGYTNDAQEYRGILLRKEAQEKELEINNKAYQEMITFLSTSSKASLLTSDATSLGLILSEFKDLQPIGRVSAEFDLTKINRNKSLDTILMDGDSIHIPAQTQNVMVYGEVVAPGGRKFQSDLDLEDYIGSSGGLSEFADSSRIVIIHPNGNASVYTKSLFALNSSNTILPGTLIYVPREIGRLDGINFAAVLAPIVSSIALSLASLNSIN
jgi:protein involved in polysaccharide export with SLBB domain